MFKDRAIVFLLITLMIDAIGIGIVFPIMPDLMDRVGAGDTGQGAFWGGLLMAAYAGALFLCGPIVGSLSDAVGRRPVLIAALVMLAIDYAIMALADSFWLLLVGRTLAGLAGATYITATAYIADISPPEKKAANFGLIGAAFGIGFVTCSSSLTSFGIDSPCGLHAILLNPFLLNHRLKYLYHEKHRIRSSLSWAKRALVDLPQSSI